MREEGEDLVKAISQEEMWQIVKDKTPISVRGYGTDGNARKVDYGTFIILEFSERSAQRWWIQWKNPSHGEDQ